jgi:hypothetical protein
MKRPPIPCFTLFNISRNQIPAGAAFAEITTTYYDLNFFNMLSSKTYPGFPKKALKSPVNGA